MFLTAYISKMKGFKFFSDKKGEWRWKLLNEEGHIVADSGEGYKRKEECQHGADLFTKHGPHTRVRLVHDPAHEDSGRGYDWECFPDKDGKWRWHYQANNNRIIADSGNRTASGPEQVRELADHVKAILAAITGIPHPDTLSLTVIVSGTPTEVVVTPHQLLREVAMEALEQTDNLTVRPLSDWTLKTRSGEVLNLNKSVEACGLTDHAQLVMSLQAGVGGNY